MRTAGAVGTIPHRSSGHPSRRQLLGVSEHASAPFELLIFTRADDTIRTESSDGCANSTSGTRSSPDVEEGAALLLSRRRSARRSVRDVDRRERRRCSPLSAGPSGGLWDGELQAGPGTTSATSLRATVVDPAAYDGYGEPADRSADRRHDHSTRCTWLGLGSPDAEPGVTFRDRNLRRLAAKIQIC